MQLLMKSIKAHNRGQESNPSTGLHLPAQPPCQADITPARIMRFLDLYPD